MKNGQDVVVFAPRRYGKSSLVWRVSQESTASGILVAHVDLMTAPTKARLAEKLARTIHEDVASPLIRARERLRIFSGLRITPVITISADDGSPSFSFDASHRMSDIDATLEHLLQLPGKIAADRGRRVALVLDEFQEIVDIDRGLPKLMRSVFQEQPEVAHLYLGSKRHMMERIFNDENEPFWRSARQMELGVIPRESFAPYLERRFNGTRRTTEPEVIPAVLDLTRGHPYATQELCYFLWEESASGGSVTRAQLDEAVARVVRSEHAHFSLIWEKAATTQRLLLQALAAEEGRPLTTAYRQRHGLPAPSSVQRALGTLVKDELVVRDGGVYRIAETFLAEWIRRNDA